MTAPTLVVAPGNVAQAAAWDGPEGDLWAARAELFERSVAGYDEALFAAAAVRETDDVLDVGCGAGSTTIAAGRRAVRGSVLGIDLSTAMLRIARTRAAEAGLGHVRFERADAQVYPLAPQSLDVVISRTGAMFFADPIAAFGNLAAALRPAGRLVLLVWQAPHRNEWFTEFMTALAAGREVPAPPPGAPSPFALADPTHVRDILTTSGFAEPALHPLEAPMCFGRDVDEAYGLVSELLGWMLTGLDADRASLARANLRASLEAHATGAGVTYGSAAWLVTAGPEAARH